MKVEVREVKPEPPPKEYVITLTKEEAKELVGKLGRIICQPYSVVDNLFTSLNRLL